MRLNFYLKTILWGLIGYPLSPVIAENIDTTVLLQEVVVSGSRQERPISRTPGMIQVISPLLLRTTPAQSVDGLLSMISGINTTRSDGLSQLHTNVSIRGLSGNEQGRTLVLYDGIPLNISDEGSVNWNSLQLNQIQRIEVLKGPGSSLYGNHAMGGVIHIISKKPTQPFAIDLAGNYGSLNSFKGSLGISRQVNERWSWMLSTYYQQSDGFNPIPDSLRTIPDYSVARFMREGGIYTKLRFTPHPLFQAEVALDIYRDKRGEGETWSCFNGRKVSDLQNEKILEVDCTRM